jgi:hypothetical protein
MAGALDPLRVPPRRWHTIDFKYSNSLTCKCSFDTLLVIVDHFSPCTRIAQIFPCIYEITVEETAKVFFKGVYRLHGLPCVLVSDKDPRFVGAFRQTLWRRLGRLTCLRVTILRMMV